MGLFGIGVDWLKAYSIVEFSSAGSFYHFTTPFRFYFVLPWLFVQNRRN